MKKLAALKFQIDGEYSRRGTKESQQQIFEEKSFCDNLFKLNHFFYITSNIFIRSKTW